MASPLTLLGHETRTPEDFQVVGDDLLGHP